MPTLHDSVQTILADQRASYSESEMSDTDALAHAWHTAGQSEWDLQPATEPLAEAYSVFVPFMNDLVADTTGPRLSPELAAREALKH
jgi:hypothetical protein